MSQETVWAIEEMGRTIRAERLAEAERYRRQAAARGPRQSPKSPRVLLAKALWALATLLDGGVGRQAHHDCRVARAA